MPRKPTLLYDRGTLILHPPPRGRSWIDFATWDDRVERFRVPAFHYRALIEAMQAEGIELEDKAKAFDLTVRSIPNPLLRIESAQPTVHSFEGDL